MLWLTWWEIGGVGGWIGVRGGRGGVEREAVDVLIASWQNFWGGERRDRNDITSFRDIHFMS